DPIEAVNRADDPTCAAVLEQLRIVMRPERERAVPARNHPWPYAERHPAGAPPPKTPPRPARALRKLLQRFGLRPDDAGATDFERTGRRALVIATDHGVLDIGKATGVFASEMTVPYYAFLDAGMEVDVASPAGGVIPVDPLSLRPI